MKIISFSPRRKAFPICIYMSQTRKQNVISLKLRIFINIHILNKLLFNVRYKIIVLNLLLKPSKEIWKIIKGMHQHDYFIREKQYYIPFLTISDKRSDLSFKKSVFYTEKLGSMLI